MKTEMLIRVKALLENGKSIRQTATILGLWPTQIIRALDPKKYLSREAKSRLVDRRYRCSTCGEIGHNRTSCGRLNGV